MADLISVYFKHRLLETARENFAPFYATATPADEGLMDALVMAHAELVVGINSPREWVAPIIRDELERATDASERIFTELREKVRGCPAFVALTAAERAQIERCIFTVQLQIN